MVEFKIKKFVTEQELLEFVNSYLNDMVVYNIYYDSRSRKYAVVYKMEEVPSE